MSKRQHRPTQWETIPEALQTALAQQALHRAVLTIAEQAELFAVQFQAGILVDRGAADGLTLFAALVRETTRETLAPVGNA
jgi:predicted phosphoribosyltransferase